jgi:membrane protein
VRPLWRPTRATGQSGARPWDRERIVRTLTFWLRPEFVLRVIGRFQKVVGFDRAIALASGALTAVIPLAILTSTFSSSLGGKDTAERIIDRYELTGGGADAVREIFSPPSGTNTGIGIIGFFFLLLAVLSFARAVQRLFEQTWDLSPLSVRNTLNGLLWIGGLSVYVAISGLAHGVLGHSRFDVTAALILAPISAVFLIWSGWTLSAKRIGRRELVAFGILGSVLLAIYSVGAAVYIPHLFSSYTTRYGVIGAVFAMISALFCTMVVVVGSAAAGREVHDELARIRNGERRADDEVRRQWNEVTMEARARWVTVRARIEEHKRGRAGE